MQSPNGQLWRDSPSPLLVPVNPKVYTNPALTGIPRSTKILQLSDLGSVAASIPFSLSILLMHGGLQSSITHENSFNHNDQIRGQFAHVDKRTNSEG
jgi:hypothetical protein